MDGLLASIVFFKSALHVEVQLALALYSLLLHVADDTLVHRLRYVTTVVSWCLASMS